MMELYSYHVYLCILSQVTDIVVTGMLQAHTVVI